PRQTSPVTPWRAGWPPTPPPSCSPRPCDGWLIWRRRDPPTRPTIRADRWGWSDGPPRTPPRGGACHARTVHTKARRPAEDSNRSSDPMPGGGAPALATTSAGHHDLPDVLPTR